MLLIFSGRRWQILEVDDQDKVIALAPAPGGTAPKFGGDPGDIHDKVVARMFELLTGDKVPVYLDTAATELLGEGRRAYRQMGLHRTRIVDRSDGAWTVATKVGTSMTTTLALALRVRGFKVQADDGFLEVSHEEEDLRSALRELCNPTTHTFVPPDATLSFEKFHPYLTRDLLTQDALSCRLRPEKLLSLCNDLLK